MKNGAPISLIDEHDARVTHAAVLLRPGQDPAYLLAAARNGQTAPEGFQFFDAAVHKGGVLCCGNCYEKDGKEVAIHHRSATAPRIGGGDQPGNRATFSANPGTVSDHGDYCRSRRLNSARAAFQQPDVKFHINIPATYSGTRSPRAAYAAAHDQASPQIRHLEPKDVRLKDREPLAVSSGMQEYLKAASSLTRHQARNALYVIDGAVGTHDQVFIDSDSWKVLHDTMGHRMKGLQAPRIFHVRNPRSVPRTDFVNAANGTPEDRIKVSMEQYEFRTGPLRHIMQPAIHTSNPEVKAMLESAGDFFVVARFEHSFFHRGRGLSITRIHQIDIQVDDPSQIVQLYRTGRPVQDFNTMLVLQQPAVTVQPVQPRPVSAPRLRDKTVAWQGGLFDEPAGAGTPRPA